MTISGRDALHQIDASIKSVRAQLTAATQEASDAEQELMDIRRNEAGLYAQVADIRLKSLGQKEAGVNALKRIDEQAIILLANHEAHVQSLEYALEKAHAHLEKLEHKRVHQADTLEAAIARHEEASERTRTRLETDTVYQERAAALEKANAIVDHAASKQKIAAQDRIEKGKPYEADPLFSYLWKRQFATKSYKAFPLFAVLDRWVAGLIRYRDARLNYERLLDLPERLDEHLAFVEEKAATLALSVETYERDALEADGVDLLRAQVEAERARLDTLDADIIAAEGAHQQAIDALNQTTRGKKGPIAEARHLLTNALQDKSIPDLKLLAAETLTPEDDALVDDLGRLRLDRYELEDAVKTATHSIESRKRGLSELEKLRRRFKQARFDSHQSEFHSAEMIDLLLTDYARGALGASDVWRRLEKSHRVRHRDWQDDFGGDDWRGGFGLPGHRSPRPSNRRGTDWSRLGHDITREIERELGRTLSDSLGRRSGRSSGTFGGNWGGLSGTRRQTRRRPRSVSIPRRSRPSRSSSRRRGSSGRRSGRRGGGFKTTGGF